MSKLMENPMASSNLMNEVSRGDFNSILITEEIEHITTLHGPFALVMLSPEIKGEVKAREVESMLVLAENEFMTIYHKQSGCPDSYSNMIFNANEVYLQTTGKNAEIELNIVLKGEPHLFHQESPDWAITVEYAQKNYQIDLTSCYVVDHI